MTFAHVVNPFTPRPGSDLVYAQPMTLASMDQAAEFARGKAGVELWAACYPEDTAVVPAGWKQTPVLTRSVMDVGTFPVNRKLPILRDILDRLHSESRADYFVYTNVDISLQPHFYVAVAELIARGYESFAINRRTVSEEWRECLPLAQADVGKSHAGFDCFVFPRARYSQFDLADTCLGAIWIGRVVLANFAAAGGKHTVFKDLHLTFHLGDDRIWLGDRLRAFNEFNERQLIGVLDRLSARPEVRQDADAMRELGQFRRDIDFYYRWEAEQTRPPDWPTRARNFAKRVAGAVYHRL